VGCSFLAVEKAELEWKCGWQAEDFQLCPKTNYIKVSISFFWLCQAVLKEKGGLCVCVRAQTGEENKTWFESCIIEQAYRKMVAGSVSFLSWSDFSPSVCAVLWRERVWRISSAQHTEDGCQQSRESPVLLKCC